MADDIRQGRPRNYNIAPEGGFAHPEAAYFAALLAEARARVFDLIADLSAEQLSIVPAGCANSIQTLVTHMTWGEVSWTSHATGIEPSDALKAIRPHGTFPQLNRMAEQLIDEAVTVFEQYTLPVLREAADLDRIRTAADGAFPRAVEAVSLRGALMHQVWHWTYHGGQVGLVRRMIGAKYSWAMERRMIGRG